MPSSEPGSKDPGERPSPSIRTQLRERLGELADLGHVGSVLSWDQQVMMPPRGAPARSEAMGTVERLAHDRLVAEELGELLDAAEADDPEIVRVVRRDRDRATRLPAELAAAITRAGADGLQAWLHAREANDFGVFVGPLRRNIELARDYAACFPESEHPYDALLDRYEPGATAAQVTELFDRLQEGLVPLISDIATRPDPPSLTGDWTIAAQRDIGLEIVQAMGYDPSAWRVDDAVHPFASSPSQTDVRITSRFSERNLMGLFALMHEVGHGLYEHGIDPALTRTTLDHGVSLGIHESQSRLWENMVGRSPAFWTYWLPRMRERFPLTLRDTDLDAFLRAINVVKPTLIRVDADEVTYSLHVIMRFELEMALIDGTLEPEDLPDAWAQKIKQMLGIAVPDDLQGVLQDIHWSEGIIGYFPTYAIGNVFAAQLWRAVRSDLPALDEDIENGVYGNLRAWLVDRVHRHGRRLTPPELIEQAVGGPLDPAPLLEHLSTKYRALYGLG